ncbi:MAG: hypothetical protein O3B37_03205 [Proteobacteria bacterium]|nr:hypothetical protein [Pseudomonadota bacterium]
MTEQLNINTASDAKETGQPGSGWFNRKANVRKLMWALYVACALSILLEIVMRAGHIGHFEKMTGLYAIAGLVGGFVLVLLAREILGRIVHRSEGYYDD